MLLQLSVNTINAKEKYPVGYVNTLQGTKSKHELTRGNTYPTIALPFGMHTWTPQTGKNGYGWKYQYLGLCRRLFMFNRNGNIFFVVKRWVSIKHYKNERIDLLIPTALLCR
jgi:hypothetical protein